MQEKRKSYWEQHQHMLDAIIARAVSGSLITDRVPQMRDQAKILDAEERVGSEVDVYETLRVSIDLPSNVARLPIEDPRFKLFHQALADRAATLFKSQGSDYVEVDYSPKASRACIRFTVPADTDPKALLRAVHCGLEINALEQVSTQRGGK